MSKKLAPYCERFQHWAEVVGRRWNGAILRVLLNGASRYSEIRRQIPGLSDRLLSERLRELEREGLVERDVTPCQPVEVRYSLSGRGRELEPVLRGLADWVQRWEPEGADPPTVS